MLKTVAYFQRKLNNKYWYRRNGNNASSIWPYDMPMTDLNGLAG
jgi:hypothetical protein